jgi:hypothetical protein
LEKTGYLGGVFYALGDPYRQSLPRQKSTVTPFPSRRSTPIVRSAKMAVFSLEGGVFAMASLLLGVDRAFGWAIIAWGVFFTLGGNALARRHRPLRRRDDSAVWGRADVVCRATR